MRLNAYNNTHVYLFCMLKYKWYIFAKCTNYMQLKSSYAFQKLHYGQAVTHCYGNKISSQSTHTELKF